MSVANSARFLMVGSGKGGVGKSLATIGTAAALARSGQRVGVLDLDVRAPNLTYLLGIPDAAEMMPDGSPVPRRVVMPGQPPVHVFSPAMLFREGASILMGGSALRSLVTDMVNTVAWPELDWLVIDMDPAPGDSLRAVRDAARDVSGLVVTTPDRTSVEDARRMLDAFADLGVRRVGLVGNMVGMRCPHCLETILNGSTLGDMVAVAGEFRVPLLARLPWDVGLHDDPVRATTGPFATDFEEIARAAMRLG